MQEKIAASQKELAYLKKEHGNTVIGEIKVSQVIGGMRGMMGLVYETSKLHPVQGINYRGHDLFEVRKQCPSAVPGGEPTPEGALWLLLTGDYPSKSEYEQFVQEFHRRSVLTAEQEHLIKQFPKDMHPMTQFSMGVLACQPSSKFAKAYREGIHKSKYFEPIFEDALDVCAKVSRIAAIVYHNCYGDVS